jgi:hypothetical protein
MNWQGVKMPLSSTREAVDPVKPANGKSVLIKAKGGMGNRMLCAATGILYAQVTRREPFVDWRDGVYGEIGHNTFFDFFRCDGVLAEPPPHHSVLPEIWKNRSDSSVAALISQLDPKGHSSKFIHRKYSIDAGRDDYTEDAVVFWNYSDRINRLRPLLRFHDSHNRSLSREQILAKFFRERCHLEPAIVARIEAFKAVNWAEAMIGVHVRYTDHKTSLAKYENPVERLIAHSPKATIFLASDNSDVERWFTQRFPRVIRTQKWLPAAGTPLHHASGCPDKREAGIEALIDMYLLAQCDSLVFPGNSTFSWISSLLNPDRRGETLDVERWNPKVILARWMREAIA